MSTSTYNSVGSISNDYETLAIAFSPDGNVLAMGNDNKNITLWDTRNSIIQPDSLETLSGHTDEVFAVAFRPDGKILASGGNDNTVRLWSVEAKKELLVLKGHSEAVNSVAFSPDGKLLASASSDKTVKLWNVDRWTTGSKPRKDTLFRLIQ